MKKLTVQEIDDKTQQSQISKDSVKLCKIDSFESPQKDNVSLVFKQPDLVYIRSG
jgi:hypothetical protein